MCACMRGGADLTPAPSSPCSVGERLPQSLSTLSLAENEIEDLNEVIKYHQPALSSTPVWVHFLLSP